MYLKIQPQLWKLHQSVLPQRHLEALKQLHHHYLKFLIFITQEKAYICRDVFDFLPPGWNKKQKNYILLLLYWLTRILRRD